MLLLSKMNWQSYLLNCVCMLFLQTNNSTHLIRLGLGAQVQPVEEGSNNSNSTQHSKDEVLLLHLISQTYHYNERAGDAEVVGFLENRESTDRGGHTTSLSDFVILVVDVLVHGTSSIQITRLTRNGSGVLLKLLTTRG